MASIVKIKRSSVQGKAPTTSDLQQGELALNTRDNKLFSSDGSSVFEIGSNVHSISVGTGGLTVGNNAFTFPNTDGSADQVLITNGSGTLSWADQTGTGGSSSSGDTTSHAFWHEYNEYTATSGQTVFNISIPDTSDVFVFHNGIKLANSDYSANSTTVTLDVAATAGDTVEVGSAKVSSIDDRTLKQYYFTANTNQTVFAGTDDFGKILSHDASSVDVYLNGILLKANTDYDYTTSTSTITLTSGVADDDLVTIHAFSPVTNWVDVNAAISSNNQTTSAITATVVDSFDKSVYRTAKYLVQITNNANSTYQSSEVSLIHDGTTTYINEYGEVKTLNTLGTIDSDISGSYVRLKVTPINSDTTIKVVRTSIAV